MAKQTISRQPTPLPPPSLTVAREHARRQLDAQLEKGLEFRKRPIPSEEGLIGARQDFQRWDAFNADLLKRIFDNSSMADEYTPPVGGVVSMDPTPQQRVEYFQEDVDSKVNRLRSIVERLDLVPEPIASAGNVGAAAPQGSSRVFVVHGHDQGTREAVARFIEKLGLEAVVLHEQANQGQTVIEKFERHASAAFAVVLLTPDDVGGPSATPPVLQPRARQNVVLELGYFFGRLGRSHVCALYKEGVELPSDITGLLYVALDQAGAWKLKLAKEMKGAGLDVDMNKAL